MNNSKTLIDLAGKLDWYLRNDKRDWAKKTIPQMRSLLTKIENQVIGDT